MLFDVFVKKIECSKNYAVWLWNFLFKKKLSAGNSAVCCWLFCVFIEKVLEIFFFFEQLFKNIF